MSIKNIVKTKIKEHQQIIEQIQLDVDKMRERLAELKKAGNQQQLMLESAKLLSLKDRMLFHKAAAMTLKDIENELNYERREQKN